MASNFCMGRCSKVIPFPTDPRKSATAAGLRYVRDDRPGITRVPAGKAFKYLSPDGEKVTDEASLSRIASLVIPPAWTGVWICPSPHGHIQAVGRDARGRKQYRYHSEYRHVRDQAKYGRMLAFGVALEKIRTRIEEDFGLPGLPRNKVLAAVVKLLESTCMRVGNDEYKKQNDSFGLTTLQDKHVTVGRTKMRFKFRGKSGQQQDIELDDPRLAKIVKKCRDIPGYELFQYYDEEGNVCDVTSADVNHYIRDITGDDFTAKDFRTWGGTGIATVALEDIGWAETQSDQKKNIVEAIKRVSQRLGNRPATCRKYYVHPALLDAYSDGSLFDTLKKSKGERRHEKTVMAVVSGYDKKLSDNTACEDLSGKLKESMRSA
jgi:DNA topoisomerase I